MESADGVANDYDDTFSVHQCRVISMQFGAFFEFFTRISRLCNLFPSFVVGQPLIKLRRLSRIHFLQGHNTLREKAALAAQKKRRTSSTLQDDDIAILVFGSVRAAPHIQLYILPIFLKSPTPIEWPTFSSSAIS